MTVPPIPADDVISLGDPDSDVVVIDPAALLFNDVDPDGDTLFLEAVDGTNLINATAEIDADGNVVVTAIDSSAPIGGSFTYVVSDRNSAVRTAVASFGTGGIEYTDISPGTTGADSLLGSDAPSDLSGGQGDDLVFGGTGDDSLSGGADDDTIQGGSGADEILGGDGQDSLSGDEGADTLDGGAGNDILSDVDGGTISGGEGDDHLIVGVLPEEHETVVDGGLGEDTLDLDLTSEQ